MSLTPDQRTSTRDELRRNFELSGVEPEQAARVLEISQSEFWEALEVRESARRETLWALRDYLWDLVLGRGLQPVRYTALTESRRQVDALWFPLSPQSRRHRGE